MSKPPKQLRLNEAVHITTGLNLGEGVSRQSRKHETLAPSKRDDLTPLFSKTTYQQRVRSPKELAEFQQARDRAAHNDAVDQRRADKRLAKLAKKARGV